MSLMTCNQIISYTLKQQRVLIEPLTETEITSAISEPQSQVPCLLLFT